MNYSPIQLLWFFFIYSFLGWVLEISYAAIRKRRFLNKGILNGPLCPIFGLGMILCSVFFGSADENIFFLSIACTVTAIILEYFTGLIIERLWRKRWWDYSGYRYNLNGYVCLPVSALWSIGAAVTLRYIQPAMLFLLNKIPTLAGRLILGFLVITLIADTLSVLGFMFRDKRYNQGLEDVAESMQQLSHRIGMRIYHRIERRVQRSVTYISQAEASKREKAAKETVFAKGCCFHKLVWLFVITAFLGDITETIFCYATSGVLMSRSSVVYGHFSIVWGLGVVVLTLMLHRYQDREDRYIFLFGTVMGGVYEYACSVFTEMVFGTVFWDYSKIPFNLGGRVNLLYCLFWGLASVVWIKILYPRISGLIERVPIKTGHILSRIIIVLMVFNIGMSALSLGRYAERQLGIAGSNSLETFLDERFPDERMSRIYPNAIIR